MRDETLALIQTLRQDLKRWAEADGHTNYAGSDAYIRGSQARKDFAEQLCRYMRIHRRREFMAILSKSLVSDPG